MTKNDIYDVFDEGGDLSRSFASYEYREGQLFMSEKIRSAYEEDAVVAIEAGTGIGKSFAYLVPALLHALEEPEDRTVIATATINLQRQLFDKDIPQLFAAMGKSCPVALVVGRANYLCIHRMQEIVSENALLAQDPLTDIGSLLAWSQKTETGLRGERPRAVKDDLWLDVCSDADFCLGYKCPYIRDCFMMKAKKKANEAKLLVSNHHLLFTDARKRMDDDIEYDDEAILPSFHRLIIDEAHNIEKNATDYFTDCYSGRELLRQLSYLNRKRRGASRSLIEDLAPYCQEPDLVDRILDQISLLAEHVDTLDIFLKSWMQSKKLHTAWIKPAHRRVMADFAAIARTVEESAGRLAASCMRLLEHNKAPEEMEGRLHELSVHAGRIDCASQVLRDFLDFDSWGDEVHWFNTKTYGKGLQVDIEVLISPLSIAPRLQRAVYEKLNTVVCTSATLDLHDNFAYWSSRVGLPLGNGKPYYHDTYHSPFDYRHQLMLLTPMDAPEFKEAESDLFIAYASDAIAKAIMSAGGGTLVLFTSYQMLKDVHENVAKTIGKDYTLLLQGSADRSILLNQFKSDTDSVLFATDSFWEGVDAPGNTLRLVIIVKLPFRVPTDPVFRARQELLDSEGKSGFFHLALPEATMKLKQGFGRLMRSTMDTGVVMILDSRVVKKGYGTFMLNALPESYHPETMTATIPDKIEAFLY